MRNTFLTPKVIAVLNIVIKLEKKSKTNSESWFSQSLNVMLTSYAIFMREYCSVEFHRLNRHFFRQLKETNK